MLTLNSILTLMSVLNPVKGTFIFTSSSVFENKALLKDDCYSHSCEWQDFS